MRSQCVLNGSGLIAILGCCGGAGLASAQHELTLQCAQPSSGVIGEEAECVDATITYGPTTIVTGRLRMRTLDTDQGRWELMNGVHISTADAELEAESAMLALADGEIVSFELSGSPSRISHVAAADGFRISAEAASIAYDVPSGALELNGSGEGSVRFLYGDNSFETCDLAYNLETRSYSTGDCELRFTVIQPEDAPSPGGERPGEP